MNRAQRRAEAKKKPRYERLTHEQQKAALFKNGITANDLIEEWNNGYTAGAQDSVRLCYAACIIAAKKVFGFHHIRGTRLLQAMDDEITMAINGHELMEKVQTEFGYHINFKAEAMSNRVEVDE